MSIGPVLLAIASAVLIVAGLYITLKDMRGKRAAPLPPPRTVTPRATPVPPPPPVPPSLPRPRTESSPRVGTERMPDGNADVTIIRREPKAIAAARALPTRSVSGPPAASGPLAPSAFAELQSAVTTITTEGLADTADTAAEGQRWPSVENRWLTIEAQIERAVGQLNAVLAPVALQIGPAGEAGWSFKNRGYGSYRRISIAGRSVAWLRSDANQENALSFKVRAHAVDQALLNATTTVPAASLTDMVVLETLSKTVRSAAEYAAWAVPKQRLEAEVSQDAWSELSAVTTEAYTIAAGALSEANAELGETARPHWDAATGHYRWDLAVGVGGRGVAAITIDLVKRSLEVASMPANAARPDLGRRRRLDLAGMTAHTLAEAIASCAWPAVADALERSGSQLHSNTG